jgi:hypothetical protein
MTRRPVAHIYTSQIRTVDEALPDVVHRMYARLMVGKTIIVADDPEAVERYVKQHWLRIMRQLQKQRNRAHHTAVLSDISQTLSAMQATLFTTLAPFEVPGSDVFIMEPEALNDIVPRCSSMFIVTHVRRDIVEAIACCMPRNGLIVLYD